MSLETEFRAGIQSYLEPLSYRLEGVLEELIRHKYPPDAHILRFEVFHDGLISEIPLNAWMFTADYGPCSEELPVDLSEQSIGPIYPDSFEKKYAALEDLEIPMQEFITWFAKRWQRAGGGSFPLRAEISPHDNHEFFDLKEGLWKPFR